MGQNLGNIMGTGCLTVCCDGSRSYKCLLVISLIAVIPSCLDVDWQLTSLGIVRSFLGDIFVNKLEMATNRN